VCNAVHRLVEQQAARRPDAIAIAEGSRHVTYRELNQRANALARRLTDSGLTRGSLARVRMQRSADLAVVLFAVLKAGACYAWVEPGSAEDVDVLASFCIIRGVERDEERYLALDIQCALADCVGRTGPNLPVLTRGSDIACVLPDAGGRPHVLVPHATITSLQTPVTRVVPWQRGTGALELWLGLISGATMAVGIASPATVAA
jgi:non-ribosomal peptide synthetase component F